MRGMKLVGNICVACFMATVPLTTPLAARAKTPVDLQLVVAVDASGSVDDREYALQLGGIAAAFRDARVLWAIAEGPTGRIGVALVGWAESNRPKAASRWHIIDDAASAETFARTVETFGRQFGGGTGIGRAMTFSVTLLERSGLASPRRVIDISGDGRETTFREWSVPPEQARHAAIDRGITINGLAILSEDPDLEAYYARAVIAGPGAFVMTAATIVVFRRRTAVFAIILFLPGAINFILPGTARGKPECFTRVMFMGPATNRCLARRSG
jgi:hypothetical protein